MSIVKRLYSAGTQSFGVLLSVCLLCALFPLPPTEGSATPPGSEGNPPTPRDTSDVIMQEDAAEVFHNIDIQKYNDMGIKCPPAEPPADGFLVGEGVRVGTILFVRCKGGYSLFGPTVMACKPSGQQAAKWSPDVPRECRETDNESYGEEDEMHEGYMDHSMIKGGGSPPFLAPGSQYWETQTKLRHRMRHQEEEKSIGRQEEVEALPPACRLRPLRGPCRASHRRFYFDVTIMECRVFVFGGCRGNGNNFQTIQECNDLCLLTH